MIARQITGQKYALQSGLEWRRNALREVMLRAFEYSDDTHLSGLIGRVRDTGANRW